jgi:hypothetical protein
VSALPEIFYGGGLVAVQIVYAKSLQTLPQFSGQGGGEVGEEGILSRNLLVMHDLPAKSGRCFEGGEIFAQPVLSGIIYAHEYADRESC